MYASPWGRAVKPTGVGQHVVRMTECLGATEGVRTSLLANGNCRAMPEQFSGLPVSFVPGPERLTRVVMLSTPLLAVDRWIGDADWVYCPKEQPVLTRRARLAVTVHDVMALEPRIPGMPGRPGLRSRLRWRLLLRRIVERADLIATVSEFTKRRILELFPHVDEERIVVVGNGISACYFSERENGDGEVLQRFGVEADGYLLTIGSLTYRKGGDLLLELAERLRRNGSGLRIVVTGRLHDRELVERYETMKRHEQSLPLDLPGYVSNEDQAVLLRNAGAFVFPSRYEGFGIPVLESMAAGTPVICSRNAALPEVAGDAALYLEGESVGELESKVGAVMDSGRGRAALISAGRERAHGWTWERCAGRLVSAMRLRSKGQ